MIAAAVIGIVGTAGSTAYQKSEADKAADEQKKLEEEARQAELDIMRASGPDGESATVTFGADKTTDLGSYDDFLVPLAKTSTDTSGLASDTTRCLCFSL